MASSDISTTPALVPGRFAGRNYLAWSKLVQLTLGGKEGFLKHIDGTAAAPLLPPRPVVPSSSTDQGAVDAAKKSLEDFNLCQKALDEWNRIDCQVRSIILNTMVTELAESFVYYASARDLWLEIERRFGASIEPQLFHLRGSLQDLRQGNDPIMLYYSKLKSLWNQIDSLRPPLQIDGFQGQLLRQALDSDKLQKFLQGLHPSYESLANQIIATHPLPSVDDAYRLVLAAEERHGAAQLVPGDDTASVLATKVVDFSDAGDTAVKKRRPKCSFCHKLGHVRERGFKLHGKSNVIAQGKPKAYMAHSWQGTPFSVDGEAGNASHDISSTPITPDFIKFMKTLFDACQVQNNSISGNLDENHAAGPTK